MSIPVCSRCDASSGSAPRVVLSGLEGHFLVSEEEAAFHLLCFRKGGQPTECTALAAGLGPRVQCLHYVPSRRRNPLHCGSLALIFHNLPESAQGARNPGETASQVQKNIRNLQSRQRARREELRSREDEQQEGAVAQSHSGSGASRGGYFILKLPGESRQERLKPAPAVPVRAGAHARGAAVRCWFLVPGAWLGGILRPWLPRRRRLSAQPWPSSSASA